jgi:hypothetical protein
MRAELRARPVPRSAILEKLLQRIEEAERRIASTRHDTPPLI